jgi:hypothetical protein
MMKAEIPPEYTADVKVVMFPQLGYLVEVLMDVADAVNVPLQYQVRGFLQSGRLLRSQLVLHSFQAKQVAFSR